MNFKKVYFFCFCRKLIGGKAFSGLCASPDAVITRFRHYVKLASKLSALPASQFMTGLSLHEGGVQKILNNSIIPVNTLCCCLLHVSDAIKV